MNSLTNNYDSINIQLDEHSVISVYDDDFVIGCPTYDSGYGKSIYNNITYIETKEYKEAKTYGGYEIFTGQDKIIARSFTSLSGDTKKEIPIYLYKK